MLSTVLHAYAVVRPDMSSTQLVTAGAQCLEATGRWRDFSPVLSTAVELEANGGIVAFADLSAISWSLPVDRRCLSSLSVSAACAIVGPG